MGCGRSPLLKWPEPKHRNARVAAELCRNTPTRYTATNHEPRSLRRNTITMKPRGASGPELLGTHVSSRQRLKHAAGSCESNWDKHCPIKTGNLLNILASALYTKMFPRKKFLNVCLQYIAQRLVIFLRYVKAFSV